MSTDNPEKTRRRRPWKIFYLKREQDVLEIGGVWQSWARSNPKHRMIFERGMIETNLPLAELRQIFRVAAVGWVDYVSDVAPSEEPSEQA